MAQLRPTPKDAAVGAAGSLAIVLAWVAELAGLDMPEPVAVSLAALLMFAAGYLFTGDNNKGRHEQ